MKKLIQNSTLLLCALTLIWACDNGFADVPIVDSPPSISIGSISSGTTEGEDFEITVTVQDAVPGSDVSQLALVAYDVTSGGASVSTGSEPVSGSDATVTFTVPGGFPAGDYTVAITATDTNGNQAAETQDFTVEMAGPSFDITGEWRMAPVAGSFQVGPSPGSGEFFASSAADVTTRACYFDDTYTFNADGTFTIDMGDATWLEASFQGVAQDECGIPVAPYSGGTYGYTYTTTGLTVTGEGAFVGLPKVNNQGELPNVDVPSEITYTIIDPTEDGENRNMTLRIEAGSGVWWDFKLTSGPPPEVSIVGTWKVEPVAGSMGVGPSPGSLEFFSISDDDVATRACFYDDTYTFNEDGTFTIEMGDQTWLETWQGVDADQCGTPVAPYASGTFDYEFTPTSLKLIGEGAHVAIPKVNNAGELPNVDVPSDITYEVVEFTEDGTTRRMTLFIESGDGIWWTFKLISE